MANTKNKTKSFLVLGLGSFGRALAGRLHQNGCRVTGIDSDPQAVQQMKDSLYEAAIGDVTDRAMLERLAVDTVDTVFVSLGEDITPSLLATLHLKELKARRIVVKGVSEEHGKILKRLGVDRVIFPEAEIAEQLADRNTWPNVVDFLPIDPEYSFVEMAVPDSFVGKTLQAVDLRREYNVWVVGVKDMLTQHFRMFPDATFILGEDQLLFVVGKQADIEELREHK